MATLVDRLKINGSLARKALNDLEEKGQIKKVVGHSKLSIYSKSTLLAGEPNPGCVVKDLVGKCQGGYGNVHLRISADYITARAVTAAE